MTLLLPLLACSLFLSVASQQDIFLGEKTETGYIDVGRGKLFYWLFEPRDKSAINDAPVLMWLTGGPGCSSSMALFYEVGPFNIKDDLTLKNNTFAWNNKAYLLLMDQPVGTGFSTAADYVVNEEQIGQDMYTFLNGFFKNHTALSTHPFYIAGESYAGHYVPAIGAYIMRQPGNEIKLQGIAIGNGLVSPYYQYAKYADYAAEWGKVSPVTRPVLNFFFYVCQGLIYLNLWPLAMMECQVNMMFIMGITFYPFFNPYDITKPCDNPPLCYDFSNVGKFLDQQVVRQRIGVGDRSYTDCDQIVHYFLLADWWFDFSPDVQYLLDEKKVKVMVYSGEKDFICNWRGGEAWVNNFEWDGHAEYNKLQYANMTYGAKNEVAANYKAYGKMSFVKVLGAGHMAPMDQPGFCLELINKFMFKGIA